MPDFTITGPRNSINVLLPGGSADANTARQAAIAVAANAAPALAHAARTDNPHGVSAGQVNYVANGSGAVTRTIQGKLRDVVSVLDFGAVPDGVTDATLAVNAAVAACAAAGGGVVHLPRGVYSLGNVNTGQSAGSLESRDLRCGIWINANNIHLIGDGPATVLRFRQDQQGHVIKMGQRTLGVSNPVNDCSVGRMTIEGGRGGSLGNLNGVDVSSGSKRVALFDLVIRQCGGYGVGFQSDAFEDCSVRNVVIEDVGDDGFDWKDNTISGAGNVIDHLTIRRYGLDVPLSEEPPAGLDLRTGVSASNITIEEPPADRPSVGIRVQNGLSGTTERQASKVVNARVVGRTQPDTSGFRIIAPRVHVINGTAVSWSDGYSVTGTDARISGGVALFNTLGYRIHGAAGATQIVASVARVNSTGFFLDGAQEATLTGCDARSNTTGYDLRGTTSGTRIIGGSIVGNATQLVNNATGTVIRFVSGFRTKNKIKGTFSVSSTGQKTVTVSHNLSQGPAIGDIQLGVEQITGVSDWEYGSLVVVSVSSTQVVARVTVTSASAIVGATANIVFTCSLRDVL